MSSRKNNRLIRLKIIFLLLFFFFFSCQNDIRTVNLFAEYEEDIPSLEANDIDLMYVDSSRTILNLKAKKIQKYTTVEKPYTIFPAGISIVFFSIYPDTSSCFSANWVMKHEKEAIWEAKGNVVARNTHMETLNTEFLIWDEKKEKIYSEHDVQITTKDEIIYGRGFEADQNFDKWKITKVSGVINLDDNE